MANRCRNEIFMNNVGVKKLEKNTEVHFDVQRNLPDCKKIRTDKYVSTEADAPAFKKLRFPANQFECLREGCVNSGTLYNEGKETVYQTREDATQFSAGIITFYVTGANSGNAVVKLSNSADFTDSWEYTINLADMATGADGYKAVVVDLSKEPTVNGEGWTPQENGAFISIAIDPEGEEIGISSISIFDDMADFDISTHVIVSCLTGIDGSFDLSAAEQTCFRNAGYDTSDLNGFEQTITGKALTPNYMMLNPLVSKGEAVKGFEDETIQKTVEELAGTDYGQIMIPDMNQDECGFFSAMLADACNVIDSQLYRYSIPSKIDLDESHYQLIDSGNGETIVLFNKDHIGTSILISYPKVVNVEEFVISDDFLDEIRVRMTYEKVHTDGVKYKFVFNNVLITSFPNALTEEETEFAFTIMIQRDSKGKFGYAYRILD